MKNLKKWISLSLLATMVCQIPLTSIASADAFDDQIAQKQAQLKQIESSKLAQSAELSQLIQEQDSLQNQISSLQSQMEQTQKEMAALLEEIENLQELIDKRQKSIENQARVLQVTDSVNMYLEAVFSAKSIADAVAQVFTMAEITSSSVDVLEQQQNDMKALNDKQVAVAQKAEQQEKNIIALSQSKEALAIKVTKANAVLVDLQLAQASAQEDINRLQAEKQEAERLAAEAARREEERRIAAEQARLAAIAAEQARIAVAKEAAEKEAARQAELARQQSTSNATTPVSNTSSKNVTVAPATPATSTPKTANITVSAVPAGAGSFIHPLPGSTVSSPFGVRYLTAGGISTSYHYGTDFVNGNPTAPIRAAASGVVVFAGYNGSAGNAVIIKTNSGLYTHYYHLSTIGVSMGATVAQGQFIGNMGNTGRSTGAHLHFGISTGIYSGYINPMTVIQ